MSDDATFDVVVVGFGGAGACAAIAAAESGASVLVIDRFYGGGSTAQSGGVIYAGAGHNAAIAERMPDRFGKSDELRAPIASPPFYAVDCSAGASRAFPFVFITLGGLVVDERAGAVQRTGGGAVDGLYAAGRAAVGLCTTATSRACRSPTRCSRGRRAGAAGAAEARAERSRADARIRSR